MKSYSLRFGMVSMLAYGFALHAFANPFDHANFDIEKDLEKFQNNSVVYMNTPAEKFEFQYKRDPITGEVVIDAKTGEPVIDSVVPFTRSLFSTKIIENKEFLKIKSQFNEGLNLSSEELPEGKAEYITEPGPLNDDPRSFVDKLVVDKLAKMEKNNLFSGKIDQEPWSGDYWPNRDGSIAFRYADKNAPANRRNHDWVDNSNYVYKNAACSVDQLSPAEKYDLLVGDPNRSLTKAVLFRGFQKKTSTFDPVEGFADPSEDRAEGWEGGCHGWSASAIMEKRPKKKITLVAADGHTKITFYPDDVKALATLLWATSAPQVRRIGARCKKSEPETDPVTGRVIDPACFDTNPGTWHLTVVNQIGVARKSFIIDKSNDTTVWNQPMHSYNYTYFNPKTNKRASTIKEAMVNLRDPRFVDKFRAFRSPKAESVVGIAMTILYVAENGARQQDKDSSADDRKVLVNYLYDLELDENGTIIGGEWYKNIHPDFMWSPNPGDQQIIASIGDKMLNKNKDHSQWHSMKNKPMPASWQKAAIHSSSPNGQPLARIVHALIDEANSWF